MSLDPDVPFTLTGQPEPQGPERVQFLSNGSFPDQRLAKLFGECINVLLSAIRYARALRTSSDQEENALQQLTISTGAIAAAEAEAILTLVTAGDSSAARIHLRTLGECDLRLRAYRADTAFALRLYRSLVASQREALKHIDDEQLRKNVEELFQRASETATDRKLTGGLLSEAEQAACDHAETRVARLEQVVTRRNYSAWRGGESHVRAPRLADAACDNRRWKVALLPREGDIVSPGDPRIVSTARDRRRRAL